MRMKGAFNCIYKMCMIIEIFGIKNGFCEMQASELEKRAVFFGFTWQHPSDGIELKADIIWQVVHEMIFHRIKQKHKTVIKLKVM